MFGEIYFNPVHQDYWEKVGLNKFRLIGSTHTEDNILGLVLLNEEEIKEHMPYIGEQLAEFLKNPVLDRASELAEVKRELSNNPVPELYFGGEVKFDSVIFEGHYFHLQYDKEHCCYELFYATTEEQAQLELFYEEVRRCEEE